MSLDNRLQRHHETAGDTNSQYTNPPRNNSTENMKTADEQRAITQVFPDTAPSAQGVDG